MTSHRTGELRPGRHHRRGPLSRRSCATTASPTSCTSPPCRCRSCAPTRSSAPESTSSAPPSSSKPRAKLADQIQGLAYASSVAVYGPANIYPPGPLADDAPLAPVTLYGVTKEANEGWAAIYWQDYAVPSVGLRPFFVYGPGRDQGVSSTPTKAMAAAAIGRPYHDLLRRHRHLPARRRRRPRLHPGGPHDAGRSPGLQPGRNGGIDGRRRRRHRTRGSGERRHDHLQPGAAVHARWRRRQGGRGTPRPDRLAAARRGRPGHDRRVSRPPPPPAGSTPSAR